MTGRVCWISSTETDPVIRTLISLALAVLPVALAAADDRRALWLANDNWEWFSQFDLNRVSFDADCDYRIRMRARVALKGGQGEAFSFGIYDSDRKKTTVQRSVSAAQVADGYAWYELPRCRLADNQLLWFAPGGFDGAKI